MLIRVGIPASFQRFSAAAKELGAPTLVSANSLRKQSGRGFSVPSPNLFNGCNVALDSAGFVAMVRYGGYPWSVADYVALAKSHPWAWWASMDFCCEPKVAPRPDIVTERVRATVVKLRDCQIAGEEAGIAPPMPVLQGWRPDDYLQCFDWMLPLALPDLIGIGSVCRRELGGPEGLMAVLARLDANLPREKKFHLFGVKGTAIEKLAGHPRIHSVDSMAWDASARVAKRTGRTIDFRISHMRRWYQANCTLLNDSPYRTLPLFDARAQSQAWPENSGVSEPST